MADETSCFLVIQNKGNNNNVKEKTPNTGIADSKD